MDTTKEEIKPVFELPLNIRPNVPNKNGIIYPSDVLDKAIEEFNAYDNKYGGILTSQSGCLDIKDIAYKINRIYKSGPNEYSGEFTIFESSEGGQLLKSILQSEHTEYKLCTVGTGRIEPITIDTIDGDLKAIGKVQDMHINYLTVLPKEKCA